MTEAASKAERKAAKKAARKAQQQAPQAEDQAVPTASTDGDSSSKKDKKKRKRESAVTADAEAIAAAPAAATFDDQKASKKSKKQARREEAAAAAAAAAEQDAPAEESAAEKKKRKKRDRVAEPPQQPAAPVVSDASTSDAEPPKLQPLAETEEPAPKSSKKKDKKKAKAAAPGAAAAAPPPAAAGGAAPITVEGMDVTPLADFDGAGFPAKLLAYVLAQKFERPTPIQSYCWPVLGAGRDIVGIAETGSGKTLAFGLPGLTRVLAQKGGSGGGGGARPEMLVLAPTRELAIQSAEVIAAAGAAAGVACACVYGGVPKGEQKRALRSARAVVATPGRLKDLMSEGAVDLSGVVYMVLDEADRMLDLGFEQDVRDIIGATARARQTAMFSATWPREIRALAAEFLREPVRVTVGDDDLTANARVAQHVEVIGERERDARLLELLEKVHGARDNRVLVFALYKKEAARLEALLSRRGYSAVAVHGDKGQADRERALAAFRSKSVPLMIATDVAARGLDIPDVEFVINYSFPLETSSYIHRIGRTGRAGKTGVSYTFFHQGDKARAGELVNVLTEAGAAVPPELLRFGTHGGRRRGKEARGRPHQGGGRGGGGGVHTIIAMSRRRKGYHSVEPCRSPRPALSDITRSEQ
ncbi:DEAD box RNA helicase [Tribonema minus]|uniref:RNA helicase n=1 Tax=Tribonema minus TaxID=303371 RepID=A0A835YU16_9STRA|nr:DEAD box RNA helicase [Tribonema minus]